jgi:hypothetical protein
MKKRAPAYLTFIAIGLLFGAFNTSVIAKTIRDSSQPAANSSLLVDVGLYDGDSGEITTGDLNSQDYWWTKFDAMMLEIALKQHQPEGRIGIDVAIALRRMDDLTKKYPKHEGIKKWKARFEEVQGKINPDANRGDSFTTECPWDESNFAQLWVNVHWLKFLVDQKNWNDAAPLVSNIKQNYQIMLAPDRMKNYPEDLRKWVVDSKPESDKLAALVKFKTGG